MAKNVLTPFATTASATKSNSTVQGKMHLRGVIRPRRRITIDISNKDIDDTARIITSLENSVNIIDGVRESIKCKTKRRR